MTILGGTPPPDPNATVAHTGVTVDQDLYGADMPAPKEMFPAETALRDTFRTRVEDVSDVLGLNEAQRQERHRGFVSTIRDAGLDPYVVGDLLYQKWTDEQLAEARGTPRDLEAQARTNSEEIRRTLRAQYGAKDAEVLLQRTEQFVKAHPKLHQLLGTGGLGSDPTIVRAIAEHVRRARFTNARPTTPAPPAAAGVPRSGSPPRPPAPGQRRRFK